MMPGPLPGINLEKSVFSKEIHGKSALCRLLRFSGGTAQQTFHVLSYDVIFQVDPVSDLPVGKRGHLSGVGDHGNLKAPAIHCRHGQTDTVHRNGSLFHDIAKQLCIRFDPVPYRIILLPDPPE